MLGWFSQGTCTPPASLAEVEKIPPSHESERLMVDRAEQERAASPILEAPESSYTVDRAEQDGAASPVLRVPGSLNSLDLAEQERAASPERELQGSATTLDVTPDIIDLEAPSPDEGRGRPAGATARPKKILRGVRSSARRVWPSTPKRRSSRTATAI